MSSKSFLTLEEALSALNETPCNEGENKDLVVALPDFVVVRYEKAMDKEDLGQNCLGLPDAAGEIEIHRNANKPKTVSFSASPPATKKCKKYIFAASDAVPSFSLPVNAEYSELEKIETSLADKTSKELFSS